MLVMILKVVAGISLIPFLLASIKSLMIWFRIPPTNQYGFHWSKVGLFGSDGSLEPAIGLIKKFKLYARGVMSASLMILYGFAVPMLGSPDMFKNIDYHYYLTFGVGLAGGWLAIGPCAHFGTLVCLNILGIDPRKRD